MFNFGEQVNPCNKNCRLTNYQKNEDINPNNVLTSVWTQINNRELVMT